MSKFNIVRKNPFDKFGQGAKIPDGKTNQSVGLRSTQAFEFFIDQAKCSELLIVPGLYQPIIPCGVGGDAAAIATALKDCFKGPEGPGVFGDIAIGTYGTGDFPTFTPTSTSTATYPHRWRLVSAGVKFSLLNNSDENEGWWECVRVTNKISELEQDDVNGSIGVIDFTSPALGTQTPFLRKKNVTPAAAAPITSENTYVSGRVRDMHQLTFTLNSISEDHDFIDMQDTAHGLSKHFDSSYDILNFRFHCRETTPLSKFVCQVSYNYEIEYQPGTLLAKMASAGWGGNSKMSRGDRMSPATVTKPASFGMKRRRGTSRSRSTKRRKTTRKKAYKKKPSYTRKARRKPVRKSRGRK